MEISLESLCTALDRLEVLETSLLAWGDTGGFFTEDEILATLEEVLPEDDPYDVLLGLCDHAMVIEAPHPEGLSKRYRTRMGEAVHLYRHLRQWFLNKPADQARTLVSDFRFVRRPRSYPCRDQSLQKLLDCLGEDASARFHLPIRALLGHQENLLLAGFQVRATNRVLQASKDRSIHAAGSIVCAGTGSGKTLAFYLPALAALCSQLAEDASSRVRILAIYPRRELLKDQFMETWSQCRKLDELVKSQSGRKISIGAFFGDTLENTSSAHEAAKKFSGNLPFDLLRCPRKDCSGKMEWRLEGSVAQREELHCSRCDHYVPHDEVRLTRRSLAAAPPDILFTTTEMLNQHLGNYAFHHLFGVGNSEGPTLVLLDEVHTYEGSSGAQTAYLLRRWMKRSECRPHFVGLSATLSGAPAFFSELIGAKEGHVELIEPLADEMVDEGAEYLMLLRGDPVSQTALLSTTIQAAMLTRRILDNRDKRSRGTWGSKTFVFTDDLDVNNRLYHQLADAEGWKTRGAQLVPDHEPLASLRGGGRYLDYPSRLKRIQLGQDWQIGMDIGHSLDNDDRALVGRTSSQDSGVDPNSEIVVATASLEVGFNDPLVGAVLQHKAPRSVASYLQRKGRAGRPRGMRPWTLVVLSEFGRDRVAFQRYEDLLTPEIKRQRLPLQNGHIQKMQGAMATLDWLAMVLKRGSVWRILKYPKGSSAQLTTLLSAVEQVLQPGGMQDRYVGYLKDAMRIDEAALQQVLWASPRSLMLSFLPTLRRQLKTLWCEYGEKWKELPRGRSPMPAFIPEAMFAELNIPNLFVSLQRGEGNDAKWEGLPFYQALREFSPGRISKRFAIKYDLADWLIPEGFQPIADILQQVDFEIAEAFGEYLQNEGTVAAGSDAELSVVRPLEIHTRALRKASGLTEKSNSRLRWDSEFILAEHTSVQKPPMGSWRKHLIDVAFCLHQQMTPLEVVRYSKGADATLRFRSGQIARVNFAWKSQGEPIAVGARQWVDGMRLRFRVCDETIADLLGTLAISAALRPLLFRRRVEQLGRFDGDPFTANWVCECFLAALAAELKDVGPAEPSVMHGALRRLLSDEGKERLLAIPQSLFQLDEQEESSREQELQADLRGLLGCSEVLAQLADCAEPLWRDIHSLPDIVEWTKELLANTLAAATQLTLCTLLGDVNERSVNADALWQDGNLEVWLSEVEAGGCGIISRLAEDYFDDPLRFLNVLACSLRPGDYEQIDFDLYELLERASVDEEVERVLTDVRAAAGHKQRRKAGAAMHSSLLRAGFALSHSFLSVLHSRILKPSSSRQTDAELLTLLKQWRELEVRSGIEWPLNIVSHTLAAQKMRANATVSDLFRAHCVNQGLLWPRGNTIRQSELNRYNPFSNGNSATERMLGAGLFAGRRLRIVYSNSYLSELHKFLREEGSVELVIPRDQQGGVSKVITEVQLYPVDYLGLLLYPRVGELQREDGSLVLVIELAEALQ
ncbi:protein DpdJ [Pseudomonas sp. SDO558_S425]